MRQVLHHFGKKRILKLSFRTKVAVKFMEYNSLPHTLTLVCFYQAILELCSVYKHKYILIKAPRSINSGSWKSQTEKVEIDHDENNYKMSDEDAASCMEMTGVSYNHGLYQSFKRYTWTSTADNEK